MVEVINDKSYDLEQRAFIDFFKRLFGEVFPDVSFTVDLYNERLDLSWDFGPCIDRVIEVLKNQGFDFLRIDYQRKSSFKLSYEKYYLTESKGEQSAELMEFFPCFKYHMEDVKFLWEQRFILEYGIQDISEISKQIEIKKNRNIYFSKDIKLHISLRETIEAATERFHEMPEYRTRIDQTAYFRSRPYRVIS